jgi:DNA-binding NarL/FixJ family response regulator
MDAILVDDHPLFLEVLEAIVAKVLPGANVHRTSNLEAALKQASRCKGLELVLLDLGLPGCSGLSALTQFVQKYPDAAVVVVSAEDSPRVIASALNAGATGYIPKTLNAKAMADALRHIAWKRAVVDVI